MSSQPLAPDPARRPDAIQSPLRVVLEERRGLGRFGRRLLWIALAISIMVNVSLFGTYQSYFKGDSDVQEKYHSLSRQSLDKIAIISVEGTITSGEGFVKKQIDRVREDEHVKAVVLRVDSPGGTVTGSDFIYHHLKKMLEDKGIKVVVSMGSVAASGGYYVAMAASGEDVIYAEPTTWTGSIGVIIPHYDLSGLLEQIHVDDDSIVSHPLKQMGSPTAKLPPEVREKERQILKELVDDSFAGFKKIVLASRPALANDEEVFTGRIFTANQALNRGLVDKLGFLEDAIDRAIELAKLDKANVRVVRYHKPSSALLEALSGQSRAPRLDLAAILDLATPRAYYLYTALPGLNLNPGK